MDVWEVPQSSRSGLDRGFLMDVGPQRATATAWRMGNWLAKGRELTGSSRVSPIAVQSQNPSVVAKATVGGI